MKTLLLTITISSSLLFAGCSSCLHDWSLESEYFRMSSFGSEAIKISSKHEAEKFLEENEGFNVTEIGVYVCDECGRKVSKIH